MKAEKLCVVICTLFYILITLMVAPAQAAQVQLAWVATKTNKDGTPLTDLAGYKLYYGQTSRSYSSIVDVGNQTTYTLSGLEGGKIYYFSVTAYDTSGNESDYSMEVSAIPSLEAPPVAVFSATPTSGLVPLTVGFTDASTGQISAWAWTFGDGGTSTQRHPSHGYTSAGSYTVSLTVTGPGGAGVETKSGYIIVGGTSTGLVAAYGFNEASGTTVVDSSGSGNHGTISGATRTTSGRFGKALVFDGVNDWVTVADASSLDLTTGMTLEAWIYPTTTSGVRDVLIKEGASVDIYNLYARNGRARPESNVYVGGLNRTAEGPVLKAKVWTHLAGTYDGSSLRLYINGIEAANLVQAGPIATSSGPLRIGGNSIWGEFFKGRIDEVRVYNRALKSGEIQVDMNTPVTAPISAPQTARSLRVATHLPSLRANLPTLRSPSTPQTGPQAKHRVQQLGESSPRGAESARDDVMPWHPDLLEFGEVQLDHRWSWVDLQKAFVDPVVIANTWGEHGAERVVIRVRNVDPTGFEIRLQRWNDQEGAHPPETTDYLVMERGTYALGNQTLVEAGSVDTDGTRPSRSLTFSRQFNVVPVVVTAVTSTNDPEAVSSELRTVTTSGVKVHLQKPNLSQLATPSETISYIAWEPSSGTMGDLTFEVNRTPQVAPGELHAIAFTEPFAAPPVSLAAMQMVRRDHPASLRWLRKALDRAEVTIDNPTSDGKTARNTGVVGYIILR